MVNEISTLDLPMQIRQALYHATEALDHLTRYIESHTVPPEISRPVLRAAGDLTIGIAALPAQVHDVSSPRPESTAPSVEAISTPPHDLAAAPNNDRQEVSKSADSENPHSPDQHPQGPGDPGL